MDYNSLVSAKSTPGSIADWCGSSVIQNSAPIIVDEAQDWIFQRLRHWRMMPPPVMATMTGNTIGNYPYVDYIAAPPDMLEPDFLMITGGLVNGSSFFQVLEERTPQEILAQQAYDSTGNPVLQTPRFYWFNNATIVFDQPADLAYPLRLLYYQMPARLSPTNPTGLLTQWCSRLFRLVIMMMAAEYLKEFGQGQFDRSYWEQLAERELALVQAASDRAKRASTGGWIEGGVSAAYAGPGWLG